MTPHPDPDRAARPTVVVLTANGVAPPSTLEEIRDNDFILTPGRYVGLEQTEDPDAEPTEKKIARLTAELLAELDRGRELEEQIRLMLGKDA